MTADHQYLTEIPANASKEEVFELVQLFIRQMGLTVIDQDRQRPWGGYFVMDEKDVPQFIRLFFPHMKPESFEGYEILSPKILLVAPGKRLSWQYHHRREEIWKVIAGEVNVVTSDTDAEKEEMELTTDDTISLRQGERHRLVGTGQWGVIAEIWQHTNPQHPSDEDDIVRVQDDFGR